MAKPILCLDFDGVIHSYASGFARIDIVSDPPTPGAIEFLAEAVKRFEVHILSSRSSHPAGMEAMQTWLLRHLAAGLATPADPEKGKRIFDQIHWPTAKPPALVTIDDRAITFTGSWPSMKELREFRPWNRRSDKLGR